MSGFIAIDPGETIGYCRFFEDGAIDLEYYDQCRFMDLEQILLLSLPLQRIIYEDYIIRRDHQGSRAETIQCIGLIRAFAQRNNIETSRQPSSILNIATKWTGVKIPSNHAESHKISAFLHGAYYLINQDLMKTKLQIEQELVK